MEERKTDRQRERERGGGGGNFVHLHFREYVADAALQEDSACLARDARIEYSGSVYDALEELQSPCISKIFIRCAIIYPSCTEIPLQFGLPSSTRNTSRHARVSSHV